MEGVCTVFARRYIRDPFHPVCPVCNIRRSVQRAVAGQIDVHAHRERGVVRRRLDRRIEFQDGCDYADGHRVDVHGLDHQTRNSICVFEMVETSQSRGLDCTHRSRSPLPLTTLDNYDAQNIVAAADSETASCRHIRRQRPIHETHARS